MTMQKLEKLLLQSSQNIPRCTSYPLANHFKMGEGKRLAEKLWDAARSIHDLSIYIHIPYCDRLCWFCGCHTKHKLSYDPIAQYVNSLTREIELFTREIGFRKRIAKVHLGGGSPSMLKLRELFDIRYALDRFGTMDQLSEISVEIDPPT